MPVEKIFITGSNLYSELAYEHSEVLNAHSKLANGHSKLPYEAFSLQGERYLRLQRDFLAGVVEEKA